MPVILTTTIFEMDGNHSITQNSRWSKIDDFYSQLVFVNCRSWDAFVFSFIVKSGWMDMNKTSVVITIGYDVNWVGRGASMVFETMANLRDDASVNW